MVKSFLLSLQRGNVKKIEKFLFSYCVHVCIVHGEPFVCTKCDNTDLEDIVNI